ncbi:MAG: 3-hydroxyacyl-CoA dehydrogenase [Beijerinckiaceae bacterium]
MASRVEKNLVLGIVGAGVMGRGIAQIAAESGCTVLLADARSESVQEALGFCTQMIQRKAAKGSISKEAAEAALARLIATDAGPANGYAAFASCDVVIEAVAERMDIKHAVRDGLEAAVAPQCIIATNTSSLSVTGFAVGARYPGRIAGLHFFNPVPLMKVAEIIGGALTETAVLDSLAALVMRTGHRAVRCTDTPGFLVNHAGRAFSTEALRIVQEGIADFATVDRIMVEAAGFRMGPFELMDLTGLDVSHTVMEQIYRQYYEEPRFRPSPITAQRLTAGLLGRKSGRGFYDYSGGQQQKPVELPLPHGATLPPVWVSDARPDVATALRAMLVSSNAVIETASKPSTEALILVTPLGADTTTTALAEGLDPARTIAVDSLFGFDRRRSLMRNPLTRPEYADAACVFFSHDGHSVSIIHDSPGFIAQRIVAMIVNVGCEIAQQRVARSIDIDAAVELGLGYPKGPLALGDALGPARILTILEAMSAFYGDPRYRPSPWLKRRALLGVSLHTQDA